MYCAKCLNTPKVLLGLFKPGSAVAPAAAVSPSVTLSDITSATTTSAGAEDSAASASDQLK